MLKISLLYEEVRQGPEILPANFRVRLNERIRTCGFQDTAGNMGKAGSAGKYVNGHLPYWSAGTYINCRNIGIK